MAESNLNINSFVKWSAGNGGLAIGQIVKIKEDKATVEGPTGLFNEVALADLIESSEDEYDNSLTDIVEKVSKKSRKGKAKASETKGEKMSDTEAMVDYKTKSEQLEAALKAAEAKMVEMETECAAVKKAMQDQYASTEKAMKDVQAELSTANDKLKAIEAEKLGLNRFEQLKSVDAIASIADDEDEAKASLSKMDEVTFATVLKVATASFKKLTDVTKSSQPKSTDQTQTSLTKLTDAAKAAETEVNAEEVLDKATLDKEADLAAAAASSTGKETQSMLEEFFAKRFSNKKNSKENKK